MASIFYVLGVDLRISRVSKLELGFGFIFAIGGKGKCLNEYTFGNADLAINLSKCKLFSNFLVAFEVEMEKRKSQKIRFLFKRSKLLLTILKGKVKVYFKL